MQGSLIVFTYASKAVLPIEDADIYITNEDKTQLIKKLTTNSSGKTEQIFIDTPDINNSLFPSNMPAFTTVSVYARKRGYFNLLINGVQIFADRLSMQNIMMLPLPEGYSGDNTEIVEIPAQNL